MKHKYLLSSLLLIATLAISCEKQPIVDEPEPYNPNTGSKTDTLAFDVDNTQAPNFDARVIYEMNLYNFTQQGTLSAAQSRLSELRTLGIDIVWLMPIQPRSKQGKIGTLGSPYAIQNYTEVNTDHGTLSDFKAFITEAHKLNMEVWLDWVPNHTGLDNVWVSQHSDYYEHNGSQIAHPNNYSDVYQLDYSNANMQQAMIDAMVYWVTNADIDGFRIDYVSSPKIPASFWQKAIPAIQQAANGKHIWMLGEADFADKKELYNVGFDYDYAWAYHDRVKQGLGSGANVKSFVSESQSLINNNNYTSMDRMVYLTNHDDIGDNFSANYFNYWGNNVAPLTVAEFTLYGMPLIYNGQEIGYRKVQNYFNRDVINWSTKNAQLQNTIRTLIALRHSQPALYSGKKADRPTVTFLQTNADNNVVAYSKTKDNNTVVVVLNFADSEIQTYVTGISAGDYELCLNSATIEQGTSKIATSLKATEYMTIPAKGYLVYVKK